MPKGQVPEREVECRACRKPFRTTKVGRAAQLCHRPECDRTRDLEHRREREAAAAQRQRERDADAERRQRARAARLEAERRDRDVQRARKRRAREAERERQRAAKATDRERARRDAKVAALLTELERLDWRPPVAVSERVAVETPTLGGGLVTDALRDLPVAVVRRHADDDVGKAALRRAIARVATAEGAQATADACRALAVEVLAWEVRLRMSAREVKNGSGPRAPGSQATSAEAVRQRNRRAAKRAELDALERAA